MEKEKRKKYLHISGRTLLVIWALYHLYFSMLTAIKKAESAELLFVGTLVFLPVLLIFIWEKVGLIFLFVISIINLIGFFFLLRFLTFDFKNIIDIIIFLCPIISYILIYQKNNSFARWFRFVERKKDLY